MYVYVLHTFLVPEEVRRQLWIHWNSSCRHMRVVMYILGVLQKNTEWSGNHWVISPSPHQVCFKESLLLVKYLASKDLTYHVHSFAFVAMEITISSVAIADYSYTFSCLLHLTNIISKVSWRIYIHVWSYLVFKLLGQYLEMKSHIYIAADPNFILLCNYMNIVSFAILENFPYVRRSRQLFWFAIC